MFRDVFILLVVISIETCSGNVTVKNRFERFLGHIGHVIHCAFSNCDKHYDPPTIHCDIVAPVTAPARSTSAKVTWSQPAGASRISGPAPGSTLQEGITHVTYTKTEHGLSNSCTMVITVKVVRCPTPAAPLHGSKSCTTTQGRMVYGDRCTFYCGTGFYMAGSSTSTCSVTARLTSSVPSCKPVPCGNPATISNGHFSCNGNTYGSVCHVVCNDGYTVDMSTKSIKCQANRHWSRTKGCLDLKPPLFQHCPTSKLYFADRGGITTRVTWRQVTAIDPPTSLTPRVIQTHGPRHGSAVSEGQYNVRFTAVDAAGNFVVHPCSFNSSGAKLDDTNLLQYMCATDHVHGSECHVTCRHGNLAGPTKIVCEKDSSFPPRARWKWEDTLGIKPYCQMLACPTLRAPHGGALSCDNWQHGALCQMQCHKGYTFPAMAPRGGIFKCGQSLKTWFPTSSVPDCLATRTFFSISMSASFYYDGHCDQTHSQDIRQNFLAVVRTSIFGMEMCKDVLACQTRNVHVTCGSRITKRDLGQKAEVKVTFTFMYSVLENDTSMKGIKRFTDTFIRMITFYGGVGKLDIGTNGLTMDNRMTSFGEVIPECKKGERELNGSCVGCGPGHVVNTTSGSCIPCPVGYYQDQDSALWCQPCPLGHTTDLAASGSFQACKVDCPPGQYSETGLSPCSPCPAGSFQPHSRATACLRCPPGTITQFSGTDSFTQCQAYDVKIAPHGDAVFKQLSRDLSHWTYSVWFQMEETPEDVMLGLWASQYEQKLFYLSLTNFTFHMFVHGNMTSRKSVNLRPTWNHCTVTASSTTGIVAVYLNGYRAIKLNYTEMLLHLPRNSRMHVMGGDAGVNIGKLTIYDYTVQETEIGSLATSCETDETPRELDLDSINHDISTGVEIIYPSVCNM